MHFCFVALDAGPRMPSKGAPHTASPSMTTTPVTLYTISGVLIMDVEGRRLLAKYYDPSVPQFADLKAQQAFERTLFNRTSGTNLNNEVAMLNGFIAVYRPNLDVVIYVLGTAQQNELMLSCVLDTIYEVFSEILKPQMDMQSLLESYEQVVLAIDEIIDRGIILETEPQEVVAKVAKAPGPSVKNLVDRPLDKQTLSSAFKLAKEGIRSLW